MEVSSCFDVCIVGAGPGGLSALSALSEPFSHDQLSVPQGHRASQALFQKQRDLPKTFCVVDPEPWLTTWRRRFSALNIKWLRSPAMAHPDLFDMASLMAFAGTRDREDELLECSVVHSEIGGLGEAHTGLWRLPSTQLFDDFCDDLVSRLPHTFFQGSSTSVCGCDGDFQVALMDGRVIQAGTVVLALGVPGPPVIPPFLASLPESLTFHTDFHEGSRLAELDKQRVLVIGGGLTAVQAAQLSLKKGCTVVICSRRKLATRHFDVEPSWFDPRYFRRHHFGFFCKPLEERVKHIKAARGGGSVPPLYMKEVREAVAKGRLEVLCGEVKIKTVAEDTVGVVINEHVYVFDRIVNACGHAPDCNRLPLVQEMLKRSPVQVIGGLPTLSQDLQWGSHKQLFVIGALATLEVGPDGGNLMGLRRAAQIVANVMDRRAWLKDTGSVLGNIRGNRYAALEDSESESESDTDAQGSLSDSATPESNLTDCTNSFDHDISDDNVSVHGGGWEHQEKVSPELLPPRL